MQQPLVGLLPSAAPTPTLLFGQLIIRDPIELVSSKRCEGKLLPFN